MSCSFDKAMSSLSILFLAFAGVSVAKPIARAQSDSTSPTTNSSDLTGNATSPSPSTGALSGAHGSGFCGTVFNTGASQNSGWPNTIWNSLTANGISDWIAFCLSPLDSCSDYNTGPLPSAMQAAQLPMIADPTKISDGINLLSSASPPSYMEIYNEPDYSFMNYTPLTSPQDAGASMSQILPAVRNTQLISPAPAFTNSDYLQQFNASCDGCMDTQMEIVAAHVYSVDPNGAVQQVTDLHGTWPNKKIWITELSPASSADQGCTLDENGMVGWMQNVLGQLKALGYVEKIYWNTGAYGALDPNNPDVCNPSLTNEDGSPTALLTAMRQVCS